jgi:hypothetical protein
MKFEFTTTSTPNTTVWYESNARLEQNLKELVNGTVSEDEVRTYCLDMFNSLRTVNNENCKEMLFLMYDEPASMPADARVEYVYRPTYLAATIMMTAMNRFISLAKDNTFRNRLNAILEAATARKFRGAGYNEYVGFMDALEIFATGDTVEFIRKYPDINEHFVSEINDALGLLEKEICTGKIRNMWSGDDYIDRGKKVLSMYQNMKNIDTEYIWYACYGSNINKERFMKYINNCSDKTPPIEDRPFMFNHSIYFAKSSGQWDNGGVAFLDDSCVGEAYGRIYKITRAQYEEVKSQEGPSYTKKIYLGEIDGTPVYSFTDTQINEPVRMPSHKYFTTILDGLKECYNGLYSCESMVSYLVDAIFSGTVFHVARAIKESEHYISNIQISDVTGLDENNVIIATKWLVKHNVIQQDQRSIRAGHDISNPDAFFFTVDSPTGRTLISVMVENMEDAKNETYDDKICGELEGVRHYMVTSRYERSGHNRLKAISLHGYKCQVCGFDFAETYGDLGRNYIEVHHVNPLAEQNGEHIVNPETDLVCLCANCHRMVHRNSHEVLAIDELKEIISR